MSERDIGQEILEGIREIKVYKQERITTPMSDQALEMRLRNL
jgi:hypothetical protein